MCECVFDVTSTREEQEGKIMGCTVLWGGGVWFVLFKPEPAFFKKHNVSVSVFNSTVDLPLTIS